MSKIKTPASLADFDYWGTEPRKAAFLTALVATGGNKLAAAEAAGVSRSVHYKWLEADERYAALYAAAMKQAGEALEDEARRRAHDGVREPIYWQGQKCGEKL